MPKFGLESFEITDWKWPTHTASFSSLDIAAMVNDVENFMSKKYVKKRNVKNVKYSNAQNIIKKFAGNTQSTTDVNSGIIATFYTKEQINL